MQVSKWKLALAAVALLTAYAVGRWSAPEKVVIKKEIVEVEKKASQSDSDKEKRKDTETHIIEHPDGTKETIITTHEEWEKHHHDSSTSDSSSSTKDDKVVQSSSSKVTISVLGGANVNSLGSPVIWGGALTKPVLGPVTVGAWGLSNGTVGASVGLTF